MRQQADEKSSRGMTLEIQTKCLRKKRPAFGFDDRNLVSRETLSSFGNHGPSEHIAIDGATLIEIIRNGFLWRPRAQDPGQMLNDEMPYRTVAVCDLVQDLPAAT